MDTSGRRKNSSVNKVSGLHPTLLVSVLALCILLIGCTGMGAAPSASSHLAINPPRRTFQVREYALVEASTDNPNHLAFQERARSGVASQRPGWFTSNADTVTEPNKALAPYGYHLAGNPSPPFSAFALYRQDQLLQRDIARFWPISISATEDWGGLQDFALSFETVEGDMLVASSEGIQPWPGKKQSARGLQKYIAPDQYVYTDNVISEAGIVAGPRSLVEGMPAADSFGQQMVDGKLFYFYTSGDLVHLNYAGKDLAYVYDQVVHDNSGENAVYNPGGTGQVAWFYALRDGLWYYVEVGMFE